MNENLIQNAAALGLGETQHAADMTKGSQLGVGLQAATLDAATPLVFPPAVIVVLQTPTMYKDDPDTARMIKALIESHAKTVSGIDFGYTLETQEQPVGHDGQNIQVPTKSKRSAVSPSFTFAEVTGNLIWSLFRQWLFDIQDPDTNASMSRFATPETFMSSAYSMSMIAIQFDPTMRPENIIDAAFYTNMFPTDPGGQLGLERQISQSKVMERTVNFTGHVQHNKTTRELGIKIATELQLAKVNYNKTQPGVTVVNAAIKDSGLSQEVASLLESGATNEAQA
jgi:hypothetical protein